MKGSLLLFSLKLNCLIFFFYQSKQLTDYIYTDIYCKLSKCIGQTPCSYDLVIYLLLLNGSRKLSRVYRSTNDSVVISVERTADAD